MTPRLHRRTRPGPDGRTAAFTLMEVLLAVVVASIVLMAISGVFFGALRLRNRTTAAVEAGLPLERALTRIRRDLSGIVPPGGTLAGALSTTAIVSTNTTVSATSASGTLQFGQAGPEFRTSTGRLGEELPWAEVQRVSYLLLESTNQTGGRDLYRSINRNLLVAGSDEPELEWLLGNVESLTFYYHDGTRWQETWDSTATTNTLPRGIKVELQRAPREVRGELPPLVELIVPLLVDGNTNQISDAMTAAAASSSSGSGSGGGSGGAP